MIAEDNDSEEDDELNETANKTLLNDTAHNMTVLTSNRANDAADHDHLTGSDHAI